MARFSSGASAAHLPTQEPERPTEHQDEKQGKALFRFFGYLLDAIRNFGKELNPTVDFRKRNLPENVFSTKPAAEIRKEICQNPYILTTKYPHSRSGQLVSRRTRTTSGHKTHYLIKAIFPGAASS